MSEKPSQNKELRTIRFYFFDAGRFPEVQSAEIDLYLIVIDSSEVIHGKVRNAARYAEIRNYHEHFDLSVIHIFRSYPLYLLEKSIRPVRIKDLVAGHDSNKVFRIRQIDNVMCPAGDHVNCFDLIAGYFEFNSLTGIDIAFLNIHWPEKNVLLPP